MKTNYLKQLLIVLICLIGLNASGKYLVEMSHIETLFDGLNVMIFFACFFPFLVLTTSILNKMFRTIYKFAHH